MLSDILPEDKELRNKLRHEFLVYKFSFFN